jgi:hypothetical protein
MNNPGFIIKKVRADFDLGKTIQAVIESPQKIAEIICQYLGITTAIDYKILELITNASVKLRPITVSFFIHRVNVYKEGLGWKKIFFFTSDKIQRQAVRIASQETEMLIDMLTNQTNQQVQELLNKRNNSTQQIINLLNRVLPESNSGQINSSEILSLLGRKQ